MQRSPDSDGLSGSLQSSPIASTSASASRSRSSSSSDKLGTTPATSPSVEYTTRLPYQPRNTLAGLLSVGSYGPKTADPHLHNWDNIAIRHDSETGEPFVALHGTVRYPNMGPLRRWEEYWEPYVLPPLADPPLPPMIGAANLKPVLARGGYSSVRHLREDLERQRARWENAKAFGEWDVRQNGQNAAKEAVPASKRAKERPGPGPSGSYYPPRGRYRQPSYGPAY